MAKIKIDKKRCKGCGLCVIVCPKKNLRADGELNESGLHPAVVIRQEDCTGCGFCFVMCPDACIVIEGDEE